MNKKDFALIIGVEHANPNGDPMCGGRPRTTLDGFGEITPECLKRKMRDRLQEGGHPILVQTDAGKVDDYTSIKARAETTLGGLKGGVCRENACKTWFDVRTFGAVLAWKNSQEPKSAKGKNGKSESQEPKSAKGKNGKSEKTPGTSIQIRGPLTVQSAFSVQPVDVTDIQITKSVNSGDSQRKDARSDEDAQVNIELDAAKGETESQIDAGTDSVPARMSSDRMGMKYRVERGIYVTFGSINPQLAKTTGFSAEDAAAIKNILPRLFENDESSARPAGSMRVLKVLWWEHDSENGQYSAAKVHNTLIVNPDGSYALANLPNLEPEEVDGF